MNPSETENSSFKNRIDLGELSEAIGALRNEIGKVVIGQQQLVEQLVIALLSRGHVLIEGVPGIAKTLTAKLLARTLSTGFSRIQLTPDLMPSDIIGTTVFNQKTLDFEFRQGPVFSNFVLVDEINRAPAKTQSALFEVMQERQVTVQGTTYTLKAPFLVIATQNPIEQEGTYPLPEAQLDRFLLKINVTYPALEEEINMLHVFNSGSTEEAESRVQAVITEDALLRYQQLVMQVQAEEKLISYIASLVAQTRNFPGIYLGASPRASVALLNASKAKAAISGRDFIIPEDIQYVSYPVLRHRLILTPEKEIEGVKVDEIIRLVIEKLEVPR